MADLVLTAKNRTAPEPISRPRPTWLLGFICLLLSLGTLLVYQPVRQHSFVALDDADYVADNPMVQAGLTWTGVKWAFTTGHSSNWHPLTWLSHMLDAQWFGPGPAAPHVVNIIFHLANTLLLFVVMRRLTDALWRSAFVAALFALHPLHVESVAWISERKDVLSGFFFLLTLWAYGKFSHRDCHSFTSLRTMIWYAAALLSFALGLMSKPMLVTLPFVLLLLDYWPLRRMTFVKRPPVDGSVTRVNRAMFGPLLIEKIPFFTLAAVSCVITFLVQRQSGAVRTLASFSMGERVENALVSYARYLGKTFWPENLAIFYPHPGDWPTSFVVGSAVLMIGISVAALRWRRAFPFAAVGWFWFCGMMVPVIGIVQVSHQSIADRYHYLPSIGLFMALAWGAAEACQRWRWCRPVLGIGAALAIAACAVRTSGQVRHWRDSESLFSHTLAVTRENFVAHNSLGHALREKGRLDEAIVQFQKSLEIRPSFAEAHDNLGITLLRKGRVDEAIEHFKKAVELQPAFALAHYNLGTTLGQEGRLDEAIIQFQQAVSLRPNDVLSRINLGNALLQKGQPDAAIAHYQHVLREHPNYADAHNNLGNAFLQKGRVDDAIIHFKKTLETEPRHANAHYNLGDVAFRRGQMEEAIARFQQTLEIQPDDAEAHHTLATALVQRGQVDEAVVHFQNALTLQSNNPSMLAHVAWVLATRPETRVRNGARALELAERANRISGGRDPVILRSLAAAYAESGRFAEATTTAQSALQLAEGQSNLSLTLKLPDQLKKYQAGYPFRDPEPTPGPENSSRP